MNPLSEARQAVVDALAGVGVRVYPSPVETPSPPCLQIIAGSEWIDAQRLAGGKVDVHLSIRVSVPAASGNIEAMVALEELVWAVAKRVPTTGTIKAPTLDQGNNPPTYYADLPVTLTASE